MKTYTVHVYDNLDILQDRWGEFDNRRAAESAAAKHLEDAQLGGWYALIIEQRNIASVVLPAVRAVVTPIK